MNIYINKLFIDTKRQRLNEHVSNETDPIESNDGIGNEKYKETEALVAEQKRRAIQYWNDSKSKHSEAMKDQVHDDVIKTLKEGKVLPIFHTLCRPQSERLFPPNRRVSSKDGSRDVIQLSAAPVTMGECNQNAICGKLSMKEERSYITAFFNNDTGTFKVEDLHFFWEFDDDYTKIVTDLVNEPSKMVGEDIEVTKLLAPLEVDDSSGRNLITRPLSRGVVADCLAKSKRRSTYAIVGNPGIGKSWTLIYTLQQALLYENACVLLCFQKDNVAIVCIRRNNKIFVWMCKDSSFGVNLDSLLFLNSNVLVLLDPAEATKGGAVYTEGPRMLIMAASNNEKHFKSTGKFTGDFARYLSCYNDAELKVALPYMKEEGKESITIDKILERASIVGNLPRYILSDSLFKQRQEQTTVSINKLINQETKEILIFDGLHGKDSTVHGCIFAVNVNLQSEKENCDRNESNVDRVYSDDDINASNIIEVDDVNSNEVDITSNIIETVDYDGQNVHDYGNRVMSIISEYVLDNIVKLSREYILSFWGITSAGLRSEMGHIVEKLFWDDLKKPYCMRIFHMKKGCRTAEEVPVLDVGKCQPVEEISLDCASLGAVVFDAKTSVIARLKKNTALVDFAGPNRRVYQVTVSPDHSMSLEGLRDLFLASGHIYEDDGALTISSNADTIGNISYYWVVPKDREILWRKKAPKLIRRSSVLGECLFKFVDQYVLVMDIVPIPSKAAA